MAITITLYKNPNTLEPVNGPLWFILSCTASSYTNFKYIFNVLEQTEPFSSTYNSVGYYTVPSRPDGYGKISANRILKSYFNSGIEPFISGWTQSVDKLVNYGIQYGLEYNPDKEWVEMLDVSGDLGLTFSTTHDFITGDIITLDKTNKQYNPDYDGTCSVVDILNTYSIKTDITLDTNTTNDTGEITNINRYIATASGYYTYRGTRQYDERETNFTNTYTMGLTSSEFLSTYPSTYKYIQTDDYETLNLLLPSTASVSFVINTYNSNNTLLDTQTYSTGFTNYKYQTIGVGPMNLSGITWTSVDKYSVHVYGTQSMSETKWYKIDNNCSPFTKTRLCFMNGCGGYDYFNFKYDNKKTYNITRTEYEKVLDWDYSIGDRGKTTLGLKVEETHSLNSDFLNENDYSWLYDLVVSPDVYIISGANKYPIIITDNNYEEKTYLRNSLFNLTINYKNAFNKNTINE